MEKNIVLLWHEGKKALYKVSVEEFKHIFFSRNVVKKHTHTKTTNQLTSQPHSVIELGSRPGGYLLGA